MSLRSLLLVIVGLCVLAVVGLSFGRQSQPVRAAFPGYNGDIVYTVYSATDDDEDYEIYVSSGTGRFIRNISNSPDSDEISATWSPDGTKIAFASDRGGSLDVYVMNPDGSNIVQLTDDPALDCCAEWSPDGSKLLFHSDRSGDFEVYSMNADGSDVTNLTNDPAFDAYGVFSPDGTKIAFSRYRELDPETAFMKIVVMNADGTDPVELTEGIGETEPNWSPDGSQIVYQGWDEDAEDYEVRVMNADGSGQRDVVDGAFQGTNPVWSPDGSKILFDHFDFREGAPSDLYVVNANGTGLELLIEGPEADFNADWQAIASPATPEPPEPTATDTREPTPTETVDAPSTPTLSSVPGLPSTGSGPDSRHVTLGWLLLFGLIAGAAAGTGTLMLRRR